MTHLIMAVTLLGVLRDVGRSLWEGFFMFWETLWALVLGFGLSGAVQAFVSRGAMHRLLGDHGPAAIARAAGLGRPPRPARMRRARWPRRCLRAALTFWPR